MFTRRLMCSHIDLDNCLNILRCTTTEEYDDWAQYVPFIEINGEKIEVISENFQHIIEGNLTQLRFIEYDDEGGGMA